MSHCVRPTTTPTHRSVAVAQGRPHTMPNPLAFVGGGAALTAAARAADKANGGGGPFRRLGEGRGAALREAWPVEALQTVPAARRAAAGDAEELFALLVRGSRLAATCSSRMSTSSTCETRSSRRRCCCTVTQTSRRHVLDTSYGVWRVS